MKTRTILASAAAFFVGLAVCLAADAQMGTWKLNEAKSKSPRGGRHHRVYDRRRQIKVIVDGVAGRKATPRVDGQFDGKDYRSGEAARLAVYTKVDDHTMLDTKRVASSSPREDRRRRREVRVLTVPADDPRTRRESPTRRRQHKTLRDSEATSLTRNRRGQKNGTTWHSRGVFAGSRVSPPIHRALETKEPNPSSAGRHENRRVYEIAGSGDNVREL